MKLMIFRFGSCLFLSSALLSFSSAISEESI